VKHLPFSNFRFLFCSINLKLIIHPIVFPFEPKHQHTW
jgi:hypothetical protein